MISSSDGRIRSEHLRRTAIVYVRQSTQGQVQGNLESTRVQRGLVKRAEMLGWNDVMIIDRDLGVSASNLSEREGFKDLLAHVVVRKVGIILCVDASRLSRNSRDWAHLFEMCSYTDTLIADLEQVYDLSHPDDRLILGIKGTVSEMELGILRTRLRTGLEEKASRGELRLHLPIGYCRDADDQIIMDPDASVRSAVRLMFEEFERRSSVRQLALWYQDTETKLPVRERPGSRVIAWKIPSEQRLYRLLDHPIYAGAYSFGRRRTEVEFDDGKVRKRIRRVPMAEWSVLIQDHHPGYIRWDQYLANRNKIAENAARWKMRQNRGAVRSGFALLTGLLRCGHCGGKLKVSYRKASALYSCDGTAASSSKRCLSFGSKEIDERVSDELCRAVSPLGIDGAITASERRDEDRRRRVENARLQLQAAQYQADRAFEQFDQCDPKNRLVAASLEERWNAKLVELENCRLALEQVQRSEAPLGVEERERLSELAGSFAMLWSHPAADPKLKKEVLRAAILEVIVQDKSEDGQLEVIIHWHGGVHTQLSVPRRAKSRGRRTDPSLIETVVNMAHDHLSDAEIARILNLQGTTTPAGLAWTQDRVQDFRHHHRIRTDKSVLDDDVFGQKAAAQYLGISRDALLALAKMNLITPNQVTEFAPWRVARSELDSEPVQRAVATLRATGRLPKGGCRDKTGRLFDDS